MSNMIEAPTEARSSLAQLERALNQRLTSGKGKLECDFREAYPLLEQYIARKMRKKALMELFNTAYEHELTLVQFRKLLNAERERRAVSGDVMICTACERPLASATNEAMHTNNGEAV
ncbi:hypothetical protein [Stenotrophomonas maltophilia]|uniref:hypothetical protein n=1 Tax=Stenotrophomonas maltophilia TaxID=40324 RepID=UPI0007492C6A|nr:hypothetical protein [Stenotrophomonas maltophilia]KUJ03918.1 hypothetical protein AR275_31910 [Stenotrophomonas maltophilia]MBH1476811.1 hypothetical protein [Stenotrophomonas maltophilia]MBH1502328.1 hypothetical protein [Stenotrophomonas maltophilia]HEL7888373.1 hypothetical protein [Stenotrophomonas maltophilia]